MTITPVNTDQLELNKDIVNDYLNYIDVKTNSVKVYGYRLSKFIKFLENRKIKSPNRATVLNYKDWLFKQNLSAYTRHGLINTLRKFFSWTEEMGLYPNIAENRRHERREDILDILEEKGFKIENIIDYTSAEEDNIFLEGTGSMILDRENEKVYAALSPRADEELIIEFCEEFFSDPVIFEAYQDTPDGRKLIYHTNVMMCVADEFAVICADCIDDKQERKIVLDHLKKSGKEIIYITEDQVNNFAGNMLQVLGADEKKYLVMSTQAYNSLNKGQINAIEKHCEILHSPLDTIEACGGGSARCMLAEIFLPQE